MNGLPFFSDKVFADSMWNLDPLPYLCIMCFFHLGARLEQSQAKLVADFTQRLTNEPLQRGNLTFFTLQAPNTFEMDTITNLFIGTEKF
jgi:hypothetical protein